MTGGASLPLSLAAIFFGNEIVKAVLIVTALFCAWLAAYRIWKRERAQVVVLEEKLRPKIKCSFSESDPGCVIRNVRVPLSSGTIIQGTFYRIKVETAGVAQVTSCFGRLRSIKRDGANIHSGNPSRLPFTPSERADAVNRTIHHGEPEYLDCVLITNDSRVFIWTSDQDGSREMKYGNLLEPAGDYEFDVSIISDSGITPSAHIPLLLRWRGTQQSAEMICLAVDT